MQELMSELSEPLLFAVAAGFGIVLALLVMIVTGTLYDWIKKPPPGWRRFLWITYYAGDVPKDDEK